VELIAENRVPDQILVQAQLMGAPTDRQQLDARPPETRGVHGPVEDPPAREAAAAAGVEITHHPHPSVSFARELDFPDRCVHLSTVRLRPTQAQCLITLRNSPLLKRD